MITLLSAAVVAFAAPLAPSPARCAAVARPAVVVSDSLRALYEGGQTYATFLGAATNRVELWRSNDARAVTLDSALVARANAIPGTWRLLVVAVDGCSDSVNTIPYIGRFAEQVPALDVRIVNSTVGRPVMEAHRTPDGRAATPTLVLLDANWNEVGCFIERPPQLRRLLADVASSESFNRKMAWYQEDGGRDTLNQIVAMIEAAAAGRTICE